MSPQDKIRINLGYPIGQLQRALSSVGQGAALRARQWEHVIAGLLDGTLKVGSRTPVSGAPSWVTLEVVHGGFATGNFAAGGPAQEHEISTLHRIGLPTSPLDRAALNAYFIGHDGRSELGHMLESGHFRVHIPEEGALLLATWLLKNRERERAESLIDTIRPYFDRLRFYPVPHPRPLYISERVSMETAGQTVSKLNAKRPNAAVARMKEAIEVWTPLYDRAVALFGETLEGAWPMLRTSDEGRLVRGAHGQPIVEGGWPCHIFPADWSDRASRLLEDYRSSRALHQLCRKPEKAKENFARLRSYLQDNVEGRAFTNRDAGMIRKILASYAWAHGGPTDERLERTRAAQRRVAALPSHSALSRVLVDRLRQLPDDEGCPALATIKAPLTAEEAATVGAPAGASLPKYLVTKAIRCLEAPVQSLIEEGVIGSAEAMAVVLPALTAHIRGSAIVDTDLRRTYQAVYLAFRRRRSLLLLDLESQAKLGELPWIAAVKPWIGSDDAAKAASRHTLLEVSRIALQEFPQTLIPNKLLREFRALAATAGLSLPFVDELAADIFMGAFSKNFLEAAKIAARILRGTLYERYYGIPFDRVLALNDIRMDGFKTPTSPGFATLCAELAGTSAGGRWSPARNGTIIEQSQILTTQNLAVLFTALDLTAVLGDNLSDMAKRCFKWICQRQQLVIRNRHAEMLMIKDTAYAWRQMIFYLTVLGSPGTTQFLEWTAEHLSHQRPTFQQRFQPVLTGLQQAAGGKAFNAQGLDPGSGGRRFLGWSVERHWLLSEAETPRTAR